MTAMTTCVSATRIRATVEASMGGATAGIGRIRTTPRSPIVMATGTRMGIAEDIATKEITPTATLQVGQTSGMVMATVTAAAIREGIQPLMVEVTSRPSPVV